MKRPVPLSSPRVSGRERTTPKRFNAVSAPQLSTPIVETSNPIISPTPLPPVVVPMDLTPVVQPPKPRRKRPAGIPRETRPRSAKTEGKSYDVDLESEEVSDEDDRIKSPVKEYYRKPAKVVEVQVGTPKKDQKRKKVHYEAIPPPAITTPFPPTAIPTIPTIPTTMVGIPIQVGAKSSSSAAGARRSGRAAIPSRQAKEALATKRRDGKIALRRAAEAAALLAGTSTTTTTIESTAAILESIRTVEPPVEMMILDQETTEVSQEEVIEKGQEYGMFGKITRWFGWRQ